MAICFKIHYWPSLLVIWVFVTVAVSSILSVGNSKLSPIPYISELGAWLPASCFFGQLMNIAALISFVVVYLRYRQVDVAIDTQTTKLNKIWNKRALWTGIFIPIGISIVANFQGNFELHLAVPIIHMFGAGMAFGIGGIYLLIQLKISFDLRPYYAKFPQFAVSKCMLYLRLIAILVYFLNLALVTPFGIATPREGNDYRFQGLQPEDAGYYIHLVSVIAEWNVLFLFLFNLLTVTNEFKVLSFEGISFKELL